MKDKTVGDERRDVVVQMLAEHYETGLSRASIRKLLPTDWTQAQMDNALHVLKKRCIISLDHGGYRLRTAPDSYNQKLIAEANAGGAKAPEPVKGVSSLDAKSLRSLTQHKADTKIAQAKIMASATAMVEAHVPAMVDTHCEHGEPIGGCIHADCVKDFVRPKPVEKGSDPTKPVAPGVCSHGNQIGSCAHPRCFKDFVPKCVDCDSTLTQDEVAYNGNTCNACESTLLAAQKAELVSERKAIEAATQKDAKFCRADIDAALKDLEAQLSERTPVEDLELKLDVLADFERMFDARLKPILAAIAKDLQR
jgi:hypothetical protein